MFGRRSKKPPPSPWQSIPHQIPDWCGRSPASRRGLLATTAIAQVGTLDISSRDNPGGPLSRAGSDEAQHLLAQVFAQDEELLVHAIAETAKLIGVKILALGLSDEPPPTRFDRMLELVAARTDPESSVGVSILRAYILGQRASSNDRQVETELLSHSGLSEIGLKTLAWLSILDARTTRTGLVTYDSPGCYQATPSIPSEGWQPSPTHVYERQPQFERLWINGHWTDRTRRRTASGWDERVLPLEPGRAPEVLSNVPPAWLN